MSGGHRGSIIKGRAGPEYAGLAAGCLWRSCCRGHGHTGGITMTPIDRIRSNRKPLVPVALLLAALGANACGHAKHQEGRLPASGEVVDQSRPLNVFTAVEVGPGFDAEILAGESFAVVVRGDRSFLPYVDTRVERGILQVRMDDRVGVRPRTPIGLTVRLPRLEALAVTGSQVAAMGLAGHSMKLTALGG